MTNPADIPPPLPWEKRALGVYSMPGGYAGYLHSLRRICEHVVSERLSSPGLASWIKGDFDLKSDNNKDRVAFLLKAGVLESAASHLHLSEYTNRWYETQDDGILIGLLHSRLQFVGEMLAELREGPQPPEELRKAARKYKLHWDSLTQINLRRCWLESARLLEPVDSGRLAITDAGRDLLAMLTVHSPDSQLSPDPLPDSTSTVSDETTKLTAPSEPGDPITDRDPSPAEELAKEIRVASTDSKKPERLEFAVRDAFQFLGFDAEKLGGSGKTDVLVKAPLGRDDSYSVTIDAKTVGSGSLGYGQVDYLTLDAHRKQHKADYSMLVGPDPSGKRLMNLAIDQAVAVLSTDQLANLCIQHADAPLGLENYRALFDSGGAVDLDLIEEEANSLTRLRDLAAEICGTLAEKTKTVGPIGASMLLMVLGQATDQSEIQQVLDTLASPLTWRHPGDRRRGIHPRDCPQSHPTAAPTTRRLASRPLEKQIPREFRLPVGEGFSSGVPAGGRGDVFC